MTYQFPEVVALANWKSLPSQALNSQTPPPPDLISSRVYRYSKGKAILTIEMRYAIEKGGSAIAFINQYTPDNASAFGIGHRQDRNLDGIGFYSLFTNRNTAYLISCINPRGGSTIKPEQFNGNRYKYDIELPRIFNWLMGKGNIRDTRCLWTELSIPLKELSQQQGYLLLESAWVDWYRWWSLRFPEEYE